jgi:ribose transport system substrate-binding protein
MAVVISLGLVASACVTVDRGAAPSSVPSHAGSSRATASEAPAASPAASTATSATPDGSESPEPASSAAAPTLPPKTQEPSIGYISLDESLPFVQTVSAGIRDAAMSAGIDLVECDAGLSAEGVIGCAEELAQAGVHGLINFQPFGALSADVCAATGGVPSVGVVFDQGDCQVARLRIDQAESGRLAGDAMGAFAAERWDCDVNAYISLESGDDDPDGRARMQGYRDGFGAQCPMPDQVFTLDGADRLATAQTQVGDLLDELKGKPNIVVGLNEDAVLGAMAAAAAAGREQQLWYSGQLADPSIRQHIACDEHYIASVAQFPERFGSPLVATLLDALEGREVAASMDADLELVTAANVRQLFPDTPACDE